MENKKKNYIILFEGNSEKLFYNLKHFNKLTPLTEI